MKLLLITHDFPYGTAETFLETEIKYASSFFDSVCVLSMSQSEELTRELPDKVVSFKVTRKYRPINCVLYAIAKLFTMSTLREVKKYSKKFGLKSTITSCVKTFLIERRLYLFCLEKGLIGDEWVAYSYWAAEGAKFVCDNQRLWKKAISRAHSYELWSNRYQPFISDTLKKLDKIYCISDDTKKLLKRIEPNSNTAVSRLGINQYSEEGEKRSVADDFVIVSCSSIYRLKRLDLIIDSLSKLSNEKKKIRWVHLGGGSDEEKIRNLCCQKLTNIDWKITGWIQNNEIVEFYKSNHIDLFINLSDLEGVPVSIMEAISFGIPCIARNVGGNSEIVNDQTGCLVESDCSADDVTAVLQEYIDGKRVTESKTIIEFFKKNYLASANYVKFYHDILL